MTYQALARKWRPRSFDQLVGQEHIVAALTHALDSDRVHHGFLFTGTRGIGKTTLARILAKCLNCEQGVGSTPCNECHACRSIDEGRFVDLIEVDAASRTQVADTRELLDNVQYAPTIGRFKVYLIDEVHMLSAHSFNALLKTLEEPPPHVKFLFATTDPQKLPVTILSRCLQFNLKLLQLDEIQEQLKRILDAESVEYETEGLRLLARSADGSMRDGLSLLDQAIAQGNGSVAADSVRQMLGLIETDYVRELVEALAGGDTRTVFGVVDAVSQRSGAYTQILDDLLTELFHLSLYKRDPALLEAKQTEADWHPSVAGLLGEEDLQLFYQIALIGKRDLPLSPDPRTGFEMVMLRMLAFRPGGAAEQPRGGAGQPAAAAAQKAAGTKAAAGAATEVPRVQEEQAPPAPAAPSAGPVAGSAPGQGPAKKHDAENAAPPPAEPASEDDWRRLARGLPLSGFAQELAMNLALQSREDGKWTFELSPQHEHLINDNRKAAVRDALAEQLGRPVDIRIHLSQPGAETPVQSIAREQSDKQKQAEQSMKTDPDVQDLIDQFDATLVEDSIRSRQ